jgi:signal transduction histidine kinase
MTDKQMISTGKLLGPTMDDMLLNADRWMATLAHELRDPLAVMIMSLDELESFCASDACARVRRNMASEGAWHLVRVIEDVLELSRFRRGRLSNPEVVELKDIVHAAKRDVNHLMASRKHDFSISIPSHAISLHGNPTQLQQLLTNLLANAGKYTDPGGVIQLSVDCAEKSVVIRIRDNGKGIAADQLPLLFEPFWQATNSCSGSMRGLGLGLSLVKMLVELNGGSIRAHSAGIGTGAEFTVTFPSFNNRAPDGSD